MNISKKQLEAYSKSFLSEPLIEKRGNIIKDLFTFNSHEVKSISQEAENTFQSKNLQTIFSCWPLFAGGDPRKSSEIFRLLPAIMNQWDVFIPQQGIQSIIHALEHIFSECGGEIQYNSEVQAIQIFNRKATGVRLNDGSILQADIVISASDVSTTCHLLIDSDRNTFPSIESAKKKPVGASYFIYHIGFESILQEKFPLTQMNLIFPSNYDHFLTDTFDHQILSQDPFFFLLFPSKIDADAAPKGCEAITMIAPVPNLSSNIIWEQESFVFRNTLISSLQNYFISDLRSKITYEKNIDPTTIQKVFRSNQGNVFGFSPNDTRINELCIPNKCRSIHNFYFTGTGAHPGPYIPGVLKRAQITEQQIFQSFHLF